MLVVSFLIRIYVQYVERYKAAGFRVFPGTEQRGRSMDWQLAYPVHSGTLLARFIIISSFAFPRAAIAVGVARLKVGTAVGSRDRD
jgi:hypothetical protein